MKAIKGDKPETKIDPPWKRALYFLAFIIGFPAGIFLLGLFVAVLWRLFTWGFNLI